MTSLVVTSERLMNLVFARCGCLAWMRGRFRDALRVMYSYGKLDSKGGLPELFIMGCGLDIGRGSRLYIQRICMRSPIVLA